MNKLQRIAFFAALMPAVFLGACSSAPVAPAPSQKPEIAASAQMPVTVNSTAATPTTAAKVGANALPPYLDPNNQLSRDRSFYFDFDKAALKAEASGLLEMHGKYLAANPDIKVRIEGNTDEAGGEEYNLALGQRRAQSVVTALKVFGVKESQLEAISFGKTKPKANGHDEASHAQNRRADLAYPDR